MRQPLDSSIGRPAIVALERLLEGGVDGWSREADCWVHRFDGGEVRYHLDSRELEIVARQEEVIQVRGEAQTRLSGVAEGEVESSGEGRYYDDEWGGHTRARAEEAARAAAEAGLDAAARRRTEASAEAAEAEHAAELERRARTEAVERLAAAAAERELALRAQAETRLEAVGARGRLLFHRLLAGAYRDALLALARARGATDVRVTETDGVLEVEFLLPGGR